MHNNLLIINDRLTLRTLPRRPNSIFAIEQRRASIMRASYRIGKANGVAFMTDLRGSESHCVDKTSTAVL